MIDSGERRRNDCLLLTKIDLNAARQWRFSYGTTTILTCEVEIEGERCWLTIDVGRLSMREPKGDVMSSKEIDPYWLRMKLADPRHVERAERILADRVFEAKEKPIFKKADDAA
jgi:hypothetical protein